MNIQCDSCGHEPQKTRKKHRRDLAECAVCGATLCTDCLKQRALDNDLINNIEADAISAADEASASFLFECSETGDKMCGKCFESTSEGSDV